MAPKGQTAAAKAKAAFARLSDKANRADERIIAAICRGDPTATQQCKRALSSMGLWPEDDDVSLVEKPKPVSSSMPAGKKPRGQLAITDGPAPDEPNKGTDPFDGRVKDELHRNYHTWQLTPVVHLKYFLSKSSPISCGYHQFKLLMDVGQKEAPKSKILEIFEFSTGQSPTESNGAVRQVSHMCDALVSMAVAHKSGIESLKFPPIWSRDGWYSIRMCPTSNVLQLKVRGLDGWFDVKVKSAVITMSFLPAVQDISSKLRAYIEVDAGTDYQAKVFCSTMASEQTGPTTRRRALRKTPSNTQAIARQILNSIGSLDKSESSGGVHDGGGSTPGAPGSANSPD